MKNINVLLSVCFMSMCFASGNEEVTPLHQIPSRLGSSPSQVAPPSFATPGQEVANNQNNLFENRKLFIDALGNEFENLLNKLGTSEEEQQKAWSVLKNSDIPFDNSSKRDYFKRVDNFMTTQLLTHKMSIGTECSTILNQIQLIKAIRDKVPKNRLENKSKEYLQSIFGQEVNITHHDKKSGAQLGIKMTVDCNDNKYNYYIKTHSQGSKKEHSSAPERFNSAELLIYKVLERLGVGPESHFFGRDSKNFYIMTLDASMENSTFIGKFTEFEKLKGNKNILGIITSYKHDYNSPISQNDIQNIENDPISQKFIYEATKLNLIVRILGLSDLFSNADNFGFIIEDEKLNKLKIVDAMLFDESRVRQESIKTFKEGNSVFSPAQASSHSLTYACKTRELKLRLKTAEEILNAENFNDFENILKKSKSNINLTVEKYIKDKEDKEDFNNQLEERYINILHNFNLFKSEISKESN